MIPNPEERLAELAEEMREPRERYFKWRQVRERYERGKSSKLGEIFLSLRETPGSPKAVEALKLSAYASKEYKQYLEEWDKAERNEIKAKVEYENLESSWESLRTAIALYRESIKQGVR